MKQYIKSTLILKQFYDDCSEEEFYESHTNFSKLQFRTFSNKSFRSIPGPFLIDVHDHSSRCLEMPFEQYRLDLKILYDKSNFITRYFYIKRASGEGFSKFFFKNQS